MNGHYPLNITCRFEQTIKHKFVIQSSRKVFQMLHLLSKANRARQLKGQLMASIALSKLKCIIRDITLWTLAYLRNPSVGLTLNLVFCVISPVLVTKSLSSYAQKWRHCREFAELRLKASFKYQCHFFSNFFQHFQFGFSVSLAFCLSFYERVFLWFVSIERFQMTSSPPCWRFKTMKRRPCRFSKPVLWAFNFFVM